MGEISFPIGPSLSDAIRLALQAKLAVGVVGPHGIGKSELLGQVADDLSLEYIVRDLSLMEPVDLVGLPVMKGNSTKFLPPSFLPTSGSGLLVMEELNRAPRHVITPCLQLLTARTLNDYNLPADWQIAAAWNEGEEYQVFELDPAMRSRFVILYAYADPKEWIKWATSRGVSSTLLSFIENSPKVFSDPSANPRAWYKVSKLLEAYEKSEFASKDSVLLAAVSGCVGVTWAKSFLKYYFKQEKPLKAAEILTEFDQHRASFQFWISRCRLDLAKSSMKNLQNHLEKQSNFDEMTKAKEQRANVAAFLSLLPADFRKEFSRWEKSRGYSKAKTGIKDAI